MQMARNRIRSHDGAAARIKIIDTSMSDDAHVIAPCHHDRSERRKLFEASHAGLVPLAL